MKTWLAVALTSLPSFLLACSDSAIGSDEDTGDSLEAASCPAVKPDPARSLFVTGPEALKKLSFEIVLNRIAATGSTTGQTGLMLYRQLVDTMNDVNHAKTQGPHCTDVVTAGKPSINGFPIECPRREGLLVLSNPFAPAPDRNGFDPVGLVNRFDLAPKNGSNCGQYRIIYAKRSGVSNATDRMFLIFEAVLPNPKPTSGLAACLPVAQFWDNLSTDKDPSSRATKLASFYLTGLPGFAPVVRAAHYGFGGGTGTGQIRANLFSGELEWQLREFRLSQQCTAGKCTLTAKNTPVQTNPFGGLFAATDAAGKAFQSTFLSQIPTLASGNVNTIAMATRAADNAGESPEQSSVNDYRARSQANTAFRKSIQDKLTAMGSKLTPENILDRATTQSCAGCHALSSARNLGGNLTWPRSFDFTHIRENGALSPALTQTFLPARAQTLVNFINSQCGPKSPISPDGDDVETIGGGLVGASN